MRLNSMDIDFAIDTLKHTSYGKASEIERALEIAIKSLTICKEMLGHTESYEIVKDKTTGITIDKYKEWYQDYTCPKCNWISRTYNKTIVPICPLCGRNMISMLGSD